MVVAGIGVTPVTEPLINSGIEVKDGVVVNEYLETNQRDIFAAGDVASYYDVLFDKHRRAEHWDNAVSQGQHCARALLGERTPFIHVPYFFSDVFDLSYEFWGDPSGAEEIVERGDLSSSSFSVWWLRQGRLAAAFTMNRPEEEREAAPRLIQSKEADFRQDAARGTLTQYSALARTFCESRTEDKDDSRSVSRSTVSAKALSAEGTPAPATMPGRCRFASRPANCGATVRKSSSTQPWATKSPNRAGPPSWSRIFTREFIAEKLQN